MGNGEWRKEKGERKKEKGKRRKGKGKRRKWKVEREKVLSCHRALKPTTIEKYIFYCHFFQQLFSGRHLSYRQTNLSFLVFILCLPHKLKDVNYVAIIIISATISCKHFVNIDKAKTNKIYPIISKKISFLNRTIFFKTGWLYIKTMNLNYYRTL